MLISLDDPETWPRDLVEWCSSATEPDPWLPTEDFTSLIEPHELLAFHCTRLTDEESTAIGTQGLRVLTAALVASKLEGVVVNGHLHRDTALRIKHASWTDDESRSGLLHLIGSSAVFQQESSWFQVAHFFSKWGGEAISYPLESDESLEELVRSIGSPYVIAVRVPLGSEAVTTHPNLALPMWMAHRQAREPSCTVLVRRNLPPENIEAIIRQGTPEWGNLFPWQR